LFLPARFFVVLAGCICGFLAAFYLPALQPVAVLIFGVFSALVFFDYSLLFFSNKRVSARRITAGRLSNGDRNKIELLLKMICLF